MAVVASEPALRKSMSKILSDSREFHACGFFATGAEALRAIPNLEAQIVLVAMTLPDLCGIRCGLELAARRPGLKIIITTSLSESAFLQLAFTAGIDGCLISPFDPARCIETLRLVSSGMDASRAKQAVPQVNQAALCTRLTDREEQVLALLSEGLLYKEIADQLGLSHALVKKLQHLAYSKLDAANRTEAVNQWRQLTSRQ